MNALILIAGIGFSIPWSLTLGCACIFSYLVGRIVKPISADNAEAGPSDVPMDLREFASKFQQGLEVHNLNIDRLREVVDELKETTADESRRELAREAEETLKSVCRLTTQLSCTNEEVGRHVSKMTASVSLATDPVTGLRTRDAMDEELIRMFSMQSRYELPFSVVSFGLEVDGKDEDPAAHKRYVRQVAKLLSKSSRGSDVIARYGGGTFVVLLPNTRLSAAVQFGQRTLAAAQSEISKRVHAGVAAGGLADQPSSLLDRCLTTLGEARGSIVNTVYVHDGEAVAAATDEWDEQDIDQDQLVAPQ